MCSFILIYARSESQKIWNNEEYAVLFIMGYNNVSGRKNSIKNNKYVSLILNNNPRNKKGMKKYLIVNIVCTKAPIDT
jgi:hypothetical protein